LHRSYKRVINPFFTAAVPITFTPGPRRARTGELASTDGV
jgi:hypothetical protein